jgi:hypothetical protein
MSKDFYSDSKPYSTAFMIVTVSNHPLVKEVRGLIGDKRELFVESGRMEMGKIHRVYKEFFFDQCQAVSYQGASNFFNLKLFNERNN